MPKRAAAAGRPGASSTKRHLARSVTSPQSETVPKSGSSRAITRHTYSPQRLRLVLALLTVLTLPVVIGSSILIYYYLRYSVMVDRRLHGERWQVPARIYARPVVLRTGLPLAEDDLVKILNGLRYEQKSDVPDAPGEFVAGGRTVVLSPRPTA